METKFCLTPPTKDVIKIYMKKHKTSGGLHINIKLRRLFKLFPSHTNRHEVKIKVAAINTIYNTSIRYVDPVVEKIVKEMKNINPSDIKGEEDWSAIVDKISTADWISYRSSSDDGTGSKGVRLSRNNISFASKYVQFASDMKSPIYDRYVWAMIAGYLQTKGFARLPKKPKNYAFFYQNLKNFRDRFELKDVCNYKLDKFLWHYADEIMGNIEQKESVDRSASKEKLFDLVTAAKIEGSSKDELHSRL